MVERITENVYRIPVTIPDNPLKELNSYLIKDGDRSLLIDTGFRMEVCRRDLLAGLEELKMDPRDMDILVTHLHGDHSGLAPEVVAPDRRIYIGAVDLPAVADRPAVERYFERHLEDMRAAGAPEELVRSVWEENPAVTAAPLPGCPNYVGLEDGAVVEAGGYKLRVILTPGHTPGHICLWDPDRATMFTGDHVLFDITPNITTWLPLADSLGDYLNGLKAMRDLPVRTALPGHRKPGNFGARIDELLEHHRARLEEAERLVAADPGVTAYDLAGRMTWSIRARDWDSFPLVQKFFALGECLSHTDHLMALGLLRREWDGKVYRYYKA